MTHKQECIANCMQYLQQLNLAYIFSLASFNQIYFKENGSTKNAYSFGLTAADQLIISYKPKTNNHATDN